MATIKVWSTNYSGNNPTQDPDPVTSVQPTLQNKTSTEEGDVTDVSQIHVVRDKVDAVARQVGDKDDNPAGSLRARTTAVENDISTIEGNITTIENDITTIEGDITSIQSTLDIQNLTEKATPVDADLVLIEDSEDGYSKKKVQVSNIGGLSQGANGTIVSSAELSANFSQAVTAGTFVDVPNLAPIEFTTIADEYVCVNYVGSIGSAAANLDIIVRFVLDGTPLDSIFHSLTYSRNLSMSRALGPLTAGTHQIKVQMTASSNSTLLSYSIYPPFPTIATRSRLEVIQYRGGLIPVQQSNTTVLSAPLALNFKGLKVTSNAGAADIYKPSSVDDAPISPTAYDDEFEGDGQGDLDPKWTWEGAGAPSGLESWGISKGSLWVETRADTGVVNNFATDAHFLLQDVPVGNWDAVAKCRGLIAEDFGRFGVYVCPSTGPATGFLCEIRHVASVIQATVQRVVPTASFTQISTKAWANTDAINTTFLRIAYDSGTTTITAYVSTDGITWFDFLGSNSYVTPWTPDRFGLWWWSLSGSANQRVLGSCDWFRVTTS